MKSILVCWVSPSLVTALISANQPALAWMIQFSVPVTALSGIRGESQQSIDTLSSTEFGNATAIHASKSVGILADDATSTVVTSDSDVVAIAKIVVTSQP